MTPPRDVVLLVTHSGDHYTVDRVAEELLQRGVRPRRIDTDRFPMELTLSAGLDGSRARHVLRDAEGEVRAEEVRALWMRRVLPPRFDDDLEPELREGCVRESLAALAGFFDGFVGCRQVNPPDANRAAENKLRQLRVAVAEGLTIPRTLVTNDPAEVRAFHETLGPSEMVAKMLTPLTQSMDGHTPFVHTSAVSAEDLEELEGLRYSPMVFQERIAKAHELRVAVVGERCFAGAIDATRSAAGQVDWRRAGATEARWTRGALPAEVAERLVRVVAALGLTYGAADLIVTPAGEHVFLEVNPGGEWGMLERDIGLPIAAALADALVAE